MKIFITGVAGFLGSHLADVFLEDGHTVVGCDNLLGGELANIPKAVQFHQCDCTDFYAMLEVIEGCDLVYHCAATAYEGLSVFSPHIVTKHIVNSSVSVFSASIQNKVKRIILCSSMARYGENQIPFVETYAPKPQDPYGIGKVTCEQMLVNLCQTHDVEYVIAVPHNIIGPRQKYDDPFRNVASIMINLMLQGRQPVIYGDGTQRRCFSFVQDCIYCLKEMATRDSVLGEIINIGPDEGPVTINELSETIAALLDFDLMPQYMPGRPKEVKLATCSSNKARELLDYSTSTSLKDGLLEMIEYIRTNGPRNFKYHLDLEIITDQTPATWKEQLF